MNDWFEWLLLLGAEYMGVLGVLVLLGVPHAGWIALGVTLFVWLLLRGLGAVNDRRD